MRRLGFRVINNANISNKSAISWNPTRASMNCALCLWSNPPPRTMDTTPPPRADAGRGIRVQALTHFSRRWASIPKSSNNRQPARRRGVGPNCAPSRTKTLSSCCQLRWPCFAQLGRCHSLTIRQSILNECALPNIREWSKPFNNQVGFARSGLIDSAGTTSSQSECASFIQFMDCCIAPLSHSTSNPPISR